MEAQTRFSSDASHELRTPLTALRAQNEVALRNPKLTLAEARKVIKNSVDQSLRLEQLSDGLLRLWQCYSQSLFGAACNTKNTKINRRPRQVMDWGHLAANSNLV